MVLNPYFVEVEREESTRLLQLPPLCAEWCAVWHCYKGEGLYSPSCFDEPFEFVV